MTLGVDWGQPASGLARISAAIAAVLVLSACGGSGQTAKSSSTTTSTHATATTPAPPAAQVLTESVADGSSTSYAAQTTAKPGERVSLRTVLPVTATSGTVRIVVAGGPGKSLKVVASALHQSSAVTVTSADGRPVTLVRLRYSCLLAPAPSFCPAKHETFSKHDYQLAFKAVRQVPIVVQAEVGPVKTPKVRFRTAAGSVVPTYNPSEVVESVAPSPASAASGSSPNAAKFRPAATVKPGETVVMLTTLAGGLVGAPQPTTITIQQGPARSLGISAQVQGGKTATATVSSASSQPIELVLPRYYCNVAPTPTFCPVSRTEIGRHRFKLTFSASPLSSPLIFVAVAQAG
jgi:hypothetical protein